MLRLSEAAAKLGVAPSTLRAFADRGLIAFTEMPNGERRFQESAVEAFRADGANPGRASHAEPSTPSQAPRPRRPGWTEVPPWERPALAAEAEVRIEKAKREIARLAADDAARAEQVERDRIAAKAALAELERQRHETQQKERAAAIAEAAKPLTEAVNAFVARRKEQAAEAAAQAARDAKARAKRLAELPEDQELESMDRAYQQRRDLLDLASVARRFRR
jgi:flagellar biosynthesis GTPase FlhF